MITVFKQRLKSIAKRLLILINSRNFVLSVFIIGFIVILYNFIFFVAQNGVNVPFWDQWDFTNIITGKIDLLRILSYQHNEHRIGVGLLITKILAHYSNWNQILEIKFISWLIISSSLLIAYVKYTVNKRIEILDLTIPLVVLNIFQYENITWGFQIAFVLPLFFLSLWTLSLKISNFRLRYAVLTTISLLSSFSSLHGLILPILTIILSAIECFRYKAAATRAFVTVAAANIAAIILYFVDYTKAFQTKPSFLPSWSMIKYFSLAVSNGFFYSTNNIPVNDFITTVVLILFVTGIWKLLTGKQKDNHTLIGCLLTFYSLAFISIICIGRSNFGIEQALSSRYITFTMLIPIGLFFISSSLKHGNYIKIAIIVFMLLNYLLFANKIVNGLEQTTNARRQALECYKTTATTDWGSCYKIFALYPNEEYLDQMIPTVLQYKRGVALSNQ